MPISLNQPDGKGYGINSISSAAPLLLLSGATYSTRHFSLAVTDKEHRYSHIALGLLELIPVIGGLAALADRHLNTPPESKEPAPELTQVFENYVSSASSTPVTKNKENINIDFNHTYDPKSNTITWINNPRKKTGSKMYRFTANDPKRLKINNKDIAIQCITKNHNASAFVSEELMNNLQFIEKAKKANKNFSSPSL